MFKKISKKSKIVASIISVLLIFSLLAGIGLAKGHSERDTGPAPNKTATATFEEVKENQKAKETSKEETEQAAEESATEPADEVPPAETSTDSTTTKLSETVTKYVNISSLNVRNGAGTEFAVLTVVTLAQELTVTETSGTWSKVTINNQTGWVSSKYLSDTKPVVEASTPPSTASNQKVAAAASPSQPATQPTNNNAADGLKTVGSNSQLILVTTNGYNTSKATIQTFERDSNGKWNLVLNTNGYVGKYGLTRDMSEGGKKAPIGKFSIGTAFGQVGNPGTRLPWRNITGDDVWVDDPNSSLYNTWQSRSATQGQWNSAENMTHPLYKYGFLINYNTERIPNKGSAIFFHIGTSYTLGCTATSESNVISILKWLDPSKNPVIIQTPVQELGSF